MPGPNYGNQNYGNRGSQNYGGRGGQNYNPSNNPPPERTLLELWPNYLEDGYFDANGNLHLDYVSRDRMEALAQAMASTVPKLTTNQLRRFFSHCRVIETTLRAQAGPSPQARWSEVAPLLHKLDVAAADGSGKMDPKFPKLFHDFIQKNVATCKSEQDFLKGFLPHFEALVGFGSQHFDRERRS